MSNFAVVPGSIYYQKESNTLSVCCKVKYIGTLNLRYCRILYGFKYNYYFYGHLSGWLGWIQNSNVKEKIVSSRFLQWVSSPEHPEEITVSEQRPVSELQRENRTKVYIITAE